MDATDAKFGIALGAAVAALVVSLGNAIGSEVIYAIRDWLSGIGRKRRGWDECPRLHAAGEFLRAKLLFGGYGKHHAYHVAGDGRVFVADAVDFYLALAAGVDNFWQIVACAERHERGTHLLSRPLEQIDFGDGERGYARVHYCGGETYVDIVPVRELPRAYDSARATADEFKYAIVDAECKAAESRGGDDGVVVEKVHGGDYSKKDGGGR